MPISNLRLAAVAVALVAATAGPNLAVAQDLPGAFRGNAYATFANVKAGAIAAQLGRSAYQPCPCEGTDGTTLSNEVDALQAGNNGAVLTAAVTLSTAHTDKTATTAEVQNTSTVSGLNLLGGLITADAIEAVADVSATAKTMTGSSAGSNLLNLKVAGVAIDPNVAPNTVLDLPQVGTVTLYKVTDTGNFKGSGQVLVEMLTINVTVSNNLGLPVGAQVVVAHALAGYNRKQPTDVVAGSAYAALANDKIGSDLENKIGKVALVTLGCEGTNGRVRKNNITADSVGTLLSIGAGVDTATSSSTPTSTTAQTTSTVTGLGLLGGLITASTITAVAQETLTGTTATVSTAGSGFAGLTVAGVPVAVTIPPNTGLTLPLLGTVVVNEQILPVNPGDHLIVNGLHVHVGLANLLGLPVGSEIVIAHADVAVQPF